MRVRLFSALILACAVLTATSASGQANRGRTTTVTVAHPGPAERLPYTADFRDTLTQTLANGATITREATKRRAVDSQGRMMTSQTQSPVSGEGEAITRVMVMDPVAGDLVHWNVPDPHSTATLGPMMGVGAHACNSAPEANRAAGNVRPAPMPMRDIEPKPATEDLGTDTIAGVGRHVEREPRRQYPRARWATTNRW